MRPFEGYGSVRVIRGKWQEDEENSGMGFEWLGEL